MPAMFEMLETRTMFSAAPVGLPHVGSIMPGVHTTVPLKNAAVTVLHFAGTVTNSQGQQTKLTVDLTALSAGGYKGVATHVNSNGSVDKLNLTVDSTGHLVLNQTEPNSQLHVTAQLSIDGKTITGTYTSSHTEQGQTFSDSGTLSLTLVTPAPSPSPAPTPAPKPTPTPKPTPSPTPAPTAGHYTGTATDADGTKSTITLDLIATSDGSRFGKVQHFNQSGALDTTFTVKFDSTGKFLYTGSDNGSPKPGQLQVTGQMSTDRSTISGSYTVTNGDGKVTTGTFSLTLSTPPQKK
jgi:hypothetical protein